MRRLAVIVATAVLAALAGAAPAAAGTYTVRQCDAAATGLSPSAPDAVADAPVRAYIAREACLEDDAALKVKSVEPAREGQEGIWTFMAPSGTRFVEIAAAVQLQASHGSRPLTYTADSHGDLRDRIAEGDTGGWQQVGWTATAGGAARLSTRLRCAPSSPADCPEAPDARAWMRNLRLTLSDTETPTVALGGALADGGWQAGSRAVTLDAADAGGGVREIEVAVNDEVVDDRVLACATLPGDGQAARLQPCPAERSESLGLDTAEAPFHEGLNSLRVCATDFGADGANRACATRTVAVDNRPPSSPEGLALDGGTGWRRLNDFQAAWSDPAQPTDAAPIAGALYEIRDAAGHTVAGPIQADGASSLAGLRVPAPGAYELAVWLADEAGNASRLTAAVVPLRFDDVAPGPVALRSAAGWLGRDELARGYVQTWSAPGDVPVSGLAGFAVKTDRSEGTNPCETAADPDPAVCAGAETTHGADEVHEELADLPEGSTWVHVAAVSGSGVRSSAVTHAELRVDLTDPEVELLGAPDGWATRPVTLTARASDALSGMQPLPGDEGAPLTVLRLDDGPVLTESGDSLTATVDKEGDHVVRFWARDLAGNRTEARTARVRLDATPPSVAFRSAQDPADPELVGAPVADSLSGVDGGAISIRPAGAEAWQPLTTDVGSGELTARVPPDLPDGQYELRAQATDVAGNAATSTKREDGEPMVLRLPLRTGTTLRAGLGPGAARLTVGYGRAVAVSGRLEDAAGRPLAGQEVHVDELFAPGSLRPQRAATVATRADGSFRLALDRGPSRSVELTYPGTASLAGANARPLRLRVAAAARLRATTRRPRVGRRFAFRGRLGHLGARLPAGGKLVELQVGRPEGWDTVRQAFRTRANGRWRFPFRFGDYYAEPTRFRFRLKVGREADWPYAPVKSRPLRITVIPRR